MKIDWASEMDASDDDQTDTIGLLVANLEVVDEIITVDEWTVVPRRNRAVKSKKPAKTTKPKLFYSNSFDVLQGTSIS